MAHQIELADSVGQNYEYASSSNPLSAQVFNGRDALWNRTNKQTSSDDLYRSNDQNNSYYQFDGLQPKQNERTTPRDGSLYANDYRDPSKFVNPFQHLNRAHNVAAQSGAHAALNAYKIAIESADRIDQRQVANELINVSRSLMQAEQSLLQARREGAQQKTLQSILEQRNSLGREQQFLQTMRMAPTYTRANAAFCLIAKGDENLFRLGEHLLKQALGRNPEIGADSNFNNHRNIAYAEHQRRNNEFARAQNLRQLERYFDHNPYEPQVSPTDSGLYNLPSFTPRNSGTQRGVGVQERLKPSQQMPPGEQPPPLQRPPGDQRPPIDQRPPGDQRPPQQTPPGDQRPPQQRLPEQKRPPQPVSPEQQKQTAPTTPRPNETQQTAKPFDHTLLAPSGDVYSPAGPPGLGESAPGEKFSSEKTSKGGWDIDWRDLKSKTLDTQGNTTYKYEGEIDDCSWYFLGMDGDTNFAAEETWSPSGQMLKRVLNYDGSLTYKVKTNDGPKELEGVKKITTTYIEADKKFATEIECSNGAVFKAETDLTGKVTKFSETSSVIASESSGISQANVDNFKHTGDAYHAARPIGIGGAAPGWAGGDNGILDNRTAQTVRESNGNVTYKYQGEIEDSSNWTLNMNGDTNFEGQEVLDAKNNLVSSFIKYGSAKDMIFVGVNKQPFTVSDVVQIRTNRGVDGNFTSTITDKKGVNRTIRSKPDGTVIEAK